MVGQDVESAWYFVVPFLTTESPLDSMSWVGMDIGSGIQERL